MRKHSVTCPAASNFVEADCAEHYWLVTMKFDTPDEAQRDAFLETFPERGLLAGQYGRACTACRCIAIVRVPN